VNVGQRFAWMRAVIAAHPRPTLAEVAVAVTLAEHFNADKGAAWPASRSIAEAVRMDRANVRRAVAGLERRGFLAPAEGRYRSKAFALTMPSTEGAAQPPHGGSHDPLKGGSTAPLKGVAQPPEQVFRSESVGNRTTAAGARSAGATRARGGGVGKAKKRPAPATVPARL
jgi:DNA-binding transcriptional MocR family regulator